MEENLLAKAEKLAQRIEEANKVTEELLLRQEKLRMQSILGGRSDAGEIQVSAEDKLKTDMKNYFKGTALEKALK